MEDAGIQDAGDVGNIHTWSNNRGAPNTIWKRLDRMLYNANGLIFSTKPHSLI